MAKLTTLTHATKLSRAAKDFALSLMGTVADSAAEALEELARLIPTKPSDIGAVSDEDVLGDALSHNGVFRGKNLTGVYTIEELHAKVSAGDFSDLYLGDYFTVSITTALPDKTVTENIQLMIAAFDYYLNSGETAVSQHHLVLIPRTTFATAAPMNNSPTTEGGYLGSYMHKTLLPCYAQSLQAALNGHLITFRDVLTSEVGTSVPGMAGAGLTGAATGWAWSDVTLQLMNEVQVYGATVFSSSGYDVGMGNRQLPVFKFIGPTRYVRVFYWLRSVADGQRFACVNGTGSASFGGISGSTYVRPLMLFG